MVIKTLDPDWIRIRIGIRPKMLDQDGSETPVLSTVSIHVIVPRTRVAENHWRSIHAAKAEKAAEERERKRREVKERIKEIEDPEKQRKMEEKENKREKKKMQPKMKQLKVKSM